MDNRKQENIASTVTGIDIDTTSATTTAYEELKWGKDKPLFYPEDVSSTNHRWIYCAANCRRSTRVLVCVPCSSKRLSKF